jgi:hypothetical protein
MTPKFKSSSYHSYCTLKVLKQYSCIQSVMFNKTSEGLCKCFSASITISDGHNERVGDPSLSYEYLILFQQAQRVFTSKYNGQLLYLQLKYSHSLLIFDLNTLQILSCHERQLQVFSEVLVSSHQLIDQCRLSDSVYMGLLTVS